MILVIGGTGTIGSEVVRLLLEQDVPFRALVRSEPKASVLQAQGIVTVMGDVEEPASLSPLLEDVEALFLLTPSVQDQDVLQIGVLDAARDAGVEYVVKVSALGASPESPLSLARSHAAVEEHLESGGLHHVILRPGSFMQNYLAMAGGIAANGSFSGALKEGRVALVDARDVAAVAGRLLVHPPEENRILPLTGPEALSPDEVAATFSRVLGRKIEYVRVSLDAYREGLLDAGLETWLVDDLVTLEEQLEAGAGAGVTEEIQDITGSAPRTFAQFVADYAEQFSE